MIEGVYLKQISKKKKILVLVILLVSIITVTPILGTQINRIVRRNLLTLGYYTIESVECTDGFGYPTILMVKPALNVKYQSFPETIIPFEYITYLDNETNYICYGTRVYIDSNSTFYFNLVIKVKHERGSQKIRYTAIVPEDSSRWTEKIWFGKLAGELLVTFRLLITQR